MLWKNKNYPGQSVTEQAWKVGDIEKELRAQLKLALKYIPKLSHISGHMGAASFNEEVKAMVVRVAKEFNLVCVDVDAANGVRASYAGLNMKDKKPDQKIDAFIEMLNTLEPGKSYVFVEHPGLDDAELKAIYHIGYENVAEDRQRVTDLFTSEKVREAILRKGIKLVSYKQLINGN
jgi:predicted glycoside hydrolase/deacetylase ChbG (UPF0249 family)